MTILYTIARANGPPPLPLAWEAEAEGERKSDEIRVSQALRDLMLSCFETEPSKRPSAHSLVEHRFSTSPW